SIHDEPDGININDACGSTYPGDLQKAVVAAGAHVGLALDGDADRVVAVDATGELVDGDQIIGACAIDRPRRGLLHPDPGGVTVMSSRGCRRGMVAHGMKVVDTAGGGR